MGACGGKMINAEAQKKMQLEHMYSNKMRLKDITSQTLSLTGKQCSLKLDTLHSLKQRSLKGLNADDILNCKDDTVRSILSFRSFRGNAFTPDIGGAALTPGLTPGLTAGLPRTPSVHLKRYNQLHGEDLRADEVPAIPFLGWDNLIAIAAHDGMKDEMTRFCQEHKKILARYTITGTQTTCSKVKEIFGDDPDFQPGPQLESGPLGGDAQIGALIAEKKVFMVIFFIDPLDVHPHMADIHTLQRLCTLHNVYASYNRATADLLMEHLQTDRVEKDYGICASYKRYTKLRKQRFANCKSMSRPEFGQGVDTPALPTMAA